MDVVLLFPGQGSQKPGMGKDLAEAFPVAREVFARVDETLGDSLSTLCFEGPAETLTLTQHAQPALLAHGAAAWAVARDVVRGKVRAAAGHSLGEFTAYHAADALALGPAVQLVRTRGTLMQQAGVSRPGAMAAILGDLTEPIESLCATATDEEMGGLVVPANFNAPGQVVVSGEVAGVERLMHLAKRAGAKRAIRLNVSGAFHSPLMAPAAEGLQAAIAAAPFAPPAFPIYANVTARPVARVEDARSLCVEQLTAPVRWTDLIQRLAASHPDALYLEVGPGSVLRGLVKKIAPDLRCAGCGTVAELEEVQRMVA